MLMEPDTEPALKPLALAFAPPRHPRGSFLAKLLDEVAVLHTISLDYVAFCPSVREKITKGHLSRRALNVLFYGHHMTEIQLCLEERGASLRSPR